jgi:D-glycero-beta-D-manno-heptose-7-phosphate kinase
LRSLDPARLDALLRGFREARVLVVGDLMLDVYLRGGAHRISPEAPVPVVHIDHEWTALGGAANVAANVVALGATCTLVGCAGEDAAGDSLLRELARLPIDPGGIVRTAGRPTTVKTRVLVKHQQVARYDRESDAAIGLDDARRITDRIDAFLPGTDVVIAEDYDKGVFVKQVIEATLDAGRRTDVPVVVDPKARHFFDYAGATLFKPNQAELAAALRAPVLADDPAWLERTRRHLDCSHLLVTLGEDGMALMTETGEHHRLPAEARSVYDVSGAGDTVTAVVAVALAAGASPLEAAILANHAAGIEVAKAGVATVSPGELIAAIAAET